MRAACKLAGDDLARRAANAVMLGGFRLPSRFGLAGQTGEALGLTPEEGNGGAAFGLNSLAPATGRAGVEGEWGRHLRLHHVSDRRDKAPDRRHAFQMVNEG